MGTRRFDPDDDATVVGDHELVVELRRIARERSTAPNGPSLRPPLPPLPPPPPPTPSPRAPERRPARTAPRAPAGSRPAPPAPRAGTTIIEWDDDEPADRRGAVWLVLIALAVIAVTALFIVLR